MIFLKALYKGTSKKNLPISNLADSHVIAFPD